MRKALPKPIKYFVPALALEHPENNEQYNLHQKLRLAVMRAHINKDFFSHLCGPLPGLFIEQSTFNQSALGYEVKGFIKC